MNSVAQRIQPREAHSLVQAGGALLVCAYDDAEKCRANHLEGAISLADFRAREKSISRSRTLIFYCA